MKLNTLLVISIVAFLASCKGQNANQSDNSKKLENQIVLSNNIMVIYQDKKNNYWFGSWQDGLYKYDGKTIIHYTTIHGLPSNRVEEIKEDKQGNIYFNTSKGLCKFEGNFFSKLTEAVSSENNWKLNPDDLWFKDAWNSENVYRYDGNFLYKLPLPKTKLGEEYILKYPNPNPYTVYSIYKDRKGNVWFGTGLLGAFRYNGKTFDWITENDVTELHGGPANGVRSIIEDKDGYFWFNSAYRYKVFDPAGTSGKSFYERQKSIGNLDGKKDSDLNEYLSIARDNDNNLWIATYRNGVWKYDSNKTKHYPVQENGIAINLFYIYKDNNGDIWLGTEKNGVWKFNGESFIRVTPH